MSQLALDLALQAPPTLANYVAGHNQEVLHHLRALVAGERANRMLYLWGARGCGKSHLARAVVDSIPAARLLGPASPLETFAQDPGCPLWVIDDVGALDAPRQQALFALCNSVRATPGLALLVTAAVPPLALAMREDLRTRLGWGLALEIVLLSDADKAQALQQRASERGMNLPPEAIGYLLTHAPRDIRTLMALVDDLDRYSLARQRAVTMPLLRDYMALALPQAFGGRGTPG